MPQVKELAHRAINNAAVPYRTMMSPTDTTPGFVTGSKDILTSIAGAAERRPGFSKNVEVNPTAFTNMGRIFTWNRFDGTFIIMCSEINASNQATVYKLISGVDNSFVLIYTDTGSSTLFDFVVSNNVVYFSNGHVAKAWEPVNGIRNWGIAIGSINAATGPNATGTGANVAATGSTASWANPGNILVADAVYSTTSLVQGSSATSGPLFPTNAYNQGTGPTWDNIANVEVADGNIASVTAGLATGQLSSNIAAFGFGFSIPLTATIVGITVEVNRMVDISGTRSKDGVVEIAKAFVGVAASNRPSATFWPFSLAVATYGSASDLWTTTWTPADINDPGFGIYFSALQTGSLGLSFPGVDYIRITVSYVPAAGAIFSDYLEATNFLFNIGALNTVLGVLVEVKGFQSVSNANTSLQAQLLKASNLSGTAKTGSNLPLSNGFISFGGTSDLWGGTWTANDINGTNFGVALQAISNTSGTVSWSVDFVRITVYSTGGPAVALSGTGLTATQGYQWVFTYGNSNSGHISSPSPPSATLKPTNQGINITLVASTDPQVNQIHVYRSTDSVISGTTAGIYFELPNSPVSNTNQTLFDNAVDTALNINSIAPIPGANDPPTPGQQPVYYSGRIWLYSTNRVFFSGLEEIVVGVPEESFPSGLAGNFWNFDQGVTGLGVAGNGVNQGLGVWCGGRIYAVAGNTLDTFRRFLISNRRGTRNQNTITSIGGMIAWYDSSSSVWATDGQSLQEISIDIRPDLAVLSPMGTSFTFHTAGKYHWLVCSFPSVTYVYDMDQQQWMPPWSISTKYVYSGETSAGNYELMLSNGINALKLNPSGLAGSFNDNGNVYQPIMITANHSVVPDFGKRFSYSSMGIYDEPSRTGSGWYIQSDTNSATTFNDVGILVDDDPLNTSAIYQSIGTNKVTPMTAWNRGQGINLVQNIYSMNGPVGRWYSIKFTLANADQADRIYDWFLAYKENK